MNHKTEKELQRAKLTKLKNAANNNHKRLFKEGKYEKANHWYKIVKGYQTQIELIYAKP